MKRIAASLAALAALAAPLASAQLVVSANDGKMTLVDGVATVLASPSPDTFAVIDLSARPPKLIFEIEAPSSIIGPPVNVAIAPGGKLALISNSNKIDPADAKKLAFDNRVSIIDLAANPPRVIGTVEAGAAPSGISINREGTLALVANRGDGTVTALRIAGNDVKNIGTVAIGGASSGPSHVVITPDGKMALVTKDNDNAVSVLAIDGDKVSYDKRDLYPGVRPYGITMAPDGKSAVVGNVGRGVGDSDTIASIDLTGKWPRVVDHLTVGQQVEGLSMSHDGKMVAATVENSSNKAKSFPFYSPNGRVVLARLDGAKLTRMSEAPVGAWVQGSVFSSDGKMLLVQNFLDRELQVFAIEGQGQLRDTGQRIKLKAGPVGIRALGSP